MVLEAFHWKVERSASISRLACASLTSPLEGMSESFVNRYSYLGEEGVIQIESINNERYKDSNNPSGATANCYSTRALLHTYHFVAK